MKNNTGSRTLLAYTSFDVTKKRIVRESMHLAISNENSTSYRKLNCDEGVLYAEADYQEEPSWGAPKSLTDPFIFRMADGRFGILAVEQALVRIQDEFERLEESPREGTLLFYSSHDLLTYKKEKRMFLEKGFIEKPNCRYDEISHSYIVSWTNWEGKRRQGITTDFNEISDITEKKTEKIDCSIKLDKAEVTCKISITEAEAQLLLEHFGTPLGENGKAEEQEGPLFIPHRADPCILKYKSHYLFVATYDEGEMEAEGKPFQRNIYMRRADTIQGLAQAEEVRVYDSHGLMVWAPEIHVVNGILMMFFATTQPEQDSWAFVQCHVMGLEGENPMDETQWGVPQRVRRRDDSYLMNDGEGITLDMTWFEWDKKQYVMWSQRTIESHRPTSSADLYIAELNQNKPYLLATEPVKITSPSYGWERKNAEVDEGPFALKHNGKLFITFSADGTDPSYRIGLLTLKENADPLCADSWIKTGYPLLGTAHNPAQPGPGHSCFTCDEQNQPVLVYHWGKEGSSRNTTAKPVVFYKDGSPNLTIPEGKLIAIEGNKK